jgi:AcrR family transcriptional regulator
VKKKSRSSTTAKPETDERVRRSKEAVLAATFQLLSETGYGGATIDAVAHRSGVAKTTIYRHWPTRSALLLDACSKLGSKPEVPDTGKLKGDLLALAGDLANKLRSARWASVLPSIIDAAERDPELADLHARLHADLWMVAFRTVVERAQRKRELPRSRDASEVVAGVVGPLFYRRWFSRESLDDRFVRSVVESALTGAQRRS